MFKANCQDAEYRNENHNERFHNSLWGSVEMNLEPTSREKS